MISETYTYGPQLAARNNGSASYIEFAEKYTTLIQKMAWRALRIVGCADPQGHSGEVAGEVHVKLLKHWGSIVSPENALYKITLNEARSHAHKCISEIAHEIHESALPAFTPVVADPTELYEAAIFIEELLSQLGEVDRRIISLRFEGVDFEQIAEQLEIPSGTIRSRYSRALKRLRRMNS